MMLFHIQLKLMFTDTSDAEMFAASIEPKAKCVDIMLSHG